VTEKHIQMPLDSVILSFLSDGVSVCHRTSFLHWAERKLLLLYTFISD